MEPGEKYLTISLFGGQIKLTAFPRSKEDKEKNPQRPHFKGNGVAVWVNKKKKEEEEETNSQKVTEEVI